MRSLLALITLIAMVAQTFHMGIIEAEFFINREQIARELCENKDKPELQCAGHCQLKKELEKKNEPQSQRPFHEMSFFIGCEVFSISEPEVITKNQTGSHTRHFHSQNFITEIFHPPGIACIS